MAGPPLAWRWLGRIRHAESNALQEQLRTRIVAGDDSAECLLLCEHDPVITLGRRAQAAHILVDAETLAARGIEVSPASRGGDVTAHGPGQLVIYPVMRLRAGVLAHVCGAGLAIVDELRDRGVEARLSRDPVGVFVGAKKIAACGVHVSRRVAIHGWALNITDESRAIFEMIVPCGLGDVPITSLERERGAGSVPLPELAASLAVRIAAAYQRVAI